VASGALQRANRWIVGAEGLQSDNRAFAAAGSWVLLVVVAIGAVVGRGGLVDGIDYWTLLTLINLGVLFLAVRTLRHRPSYQVVVAWGIILVYVLGGLLQTYLLNYNVNANTSFVALQDPELSFATQGDIAHAYTLITLSFLLSTLVAVVWASLPLRPRFPLRATSRTVSRLVALLLWLSVGDLIFTIFQKIEGFGVLDIRPKALPLHLVAVTLFYRQFLFPSALLVGIWVFDSRDDRRKMWWCVAGTAMATAVDAYLSTSRGDALYFGLPVLFLWIVTRRFTKFRKVLLVFGLLAYLVATPVLTELRASKALEAQHVVTATGVAVTKPAILSPAGIDQSIGHTLIRVGGSGSVMEAATAEKPLSATGLYDIYRPSGLSTYFTEDVVGVSESSTIQEGRAPTVMGLGLLVGGTLGLVVVSVLTMSLMAFGWRSIVRRMCTWPVALALFAEGALRFYSEGVPIQLYKTVIVILAIEFGYRFLVNGDRGRNLAPRLSPPHPRRDAGGRRRLRSEWYPFAPHRDPTRAARREERPAAVKAPDP
jgi:hypothetical protein